VRDASGSLVSATQVESTQIHVSARRDYYVPTPTWWSALEVPYEFPARMPRGRRSGGSGPCPSVRWRGNADFGWSRPPSCLSRVGSIAPPE